MSKARICAVICVRNEIGYLPTLLQHLRREGVDIACIDHSSTDGTFELLESRLGHEVVHLERMPFDGVFSLENVLAQKRRVITQIPHDWVLHQDGDEILQANENGKRLCDLVEEAETKGCNVINFDEFVFLPESAEISSVDGSHMSWTRYYFFELMPIRLMRLWRRQDDLDNRGAGGHKLEGEVRLFQQSQILRHYITLGQSHIEAKYLGRRFAPEALAKGWHGNRIGLTRDQLSIDRVPDERMSRLVDASSRDFDRSNPYKKHFWHWGTV